MNELMETRTITRVLVTGGAGSVGLEVLKELHQHRKWYQVKVLEQNSASVLRKLKPFRKDFQLLFGDITDRKILDKAATEVDFVIHLAAVIPPVADHDPELAEKTNVLGTKMLIESLHRLSPSAFFLNTSSISVYGDRVYNPWITVEDPLLPSEGDQYALTKMRAEKLVMKSRLRWSIYRLSAIMGPQTRLNPLFFHMPLETSLEIATARDTGYALVESIYHQAEIKGKIFNLSGGEGCRTSYRDFLVEVFKSMGLSKINLPDSAFAQRNFHCGNYLDCGELEEILHFQQDNLDDYYKMLSTNGSAFSKFFLSLFPAMIKMFLLSRSDPRRAKRKKNPVQIRRFFFINQPGWR